MTGKPRRHSVRSRVLHVFTLYTHVDAPLIARALRQPTSTISGLLNQFVREGKVKVVPGRTERRPYARNLYSLRAP